MGAFSRRRVLVLVSFAGLITAVALAILLPHGLDVGESECIGRLPSIEPDYVGVTIPPNIAPLNFIIQEPGDRFLVRISSGSGPAMEVAGKNPCVKIPERKWRRLLEKNRGGEVILQVYAKAGNGRVKKFRTIVYRVAEEEIDGCLVYRLIDAGYSLWNNMGIYQRELGEFTQKPIILNRMLRYNCINCHSFCCNNPERMLFHQRTGPSGTILAIEGDLTNLSTATKMGKGGVYPYWHPDGDIIAFSVNTVFQIFHSHGENRDVYDEHSDIVLYSLSSNIITTAPELSSPDYMENLPAWAPDGRHLYFIRSLSFDSYKDKMAVNGDSLDIFKYHEVKYSLMRIAYEPETGTWGKLDTVISSDSTGQSISWPRVSPDGRYLMFCMSDHGYFTIHYPETDLYLMDLESGTYRRLDEANSAMTDSYHSWSSNSRWFVFSSKRMDGLFARPYLCYLDREGRAGKPFVLPQKDPEFYSSFLKTYNVPELVSGPVKTRPRQLADAAYGKKKVLQAVLDPNIKAPEVKQGTTSPWSKVME